MKTPADAIRTRGEIAKILGVSISTVQRMRDAGLPARREGARGRVIADRDEVLAWHAQFCANGRRTRGF